MEGWKLNKPTPPEDNMPSQRIFAVKFHPKDYDIFLTGGWDNNVKVRHHFGLKTPFSGFAPRRPMDKLGIRNKGL